MKQEMIYIINGGRGCCLTASEIASLLHNDHSLWASTLSISIVIFILKYI